MNPLAISAPSGSAWKHQWNVVWTLAMREIRGRYAGSVAGTAWTILGPALTILIFLFVFSEIMMSRLGEGSGPADYALYLCTGIIPWSSFQEAVHRGNTVFIENANLIKRLFFPREILILQTVLVSTISLIIGLGLILIVLLVIGRFPGWNVLLLLPAVGIQTVMVFGLGLAFATFNVFFRDLSHAMGILLHLWFWLSPIVYPAEIIPERFALLLQLNPVTHLVGLYRTALLNSPPPGPAGILGTVAFSLLILWISLKLYRRLSPKIVDEV